MILESKCKGDYVGQYFANLTLAQVKTLDCGLQLSTGRRYVEDHILVCIILKYQYIPEPT